MLSSAAENIWKCAISRHQEPEALFHERIVGELHQVFINDLGARFCPDVGPEIDGLCVRSGKTHKEHGGGAGKVDGCEYIGLDNASDIDNGHWPDVKPERCPSATVLTPEISGSPTRKRFSSKSSLLTCREAARGPGLD
jgi:hypothetical protein